VKALTRLLTSAECDVPEATALVEVFARMSPHCSLVDVYQYLLQAAESRNESCCFALAAIAQQSLPKLTTRYSRRLIAVVKVFLASENEAQHRAAAEVVAKMARRTSYFEVIASDLFPKAMQKALLTTRNADVFESLLVSARQCKIAVGQEVVRAAEQIALTLAEAPENGEAAERGRKIAALAKEPLNGTK
jgi:hypothetical protein